MNEESKLKTKIKERKKEIFIGLLLALIVSLSFGIGYLAALERNRAPIIIQKYSQ